jgi:hypothetical protein
MRLRINMAGIAIVDIGVSSCDEDGNGVLMPVICAREPAMSLEGADRFLGLPLVPS